MAEEYPVAPARMASLRDKNGSSSEKEKKKGWFGKNKGVFPSVRPLVLLRAKVSDYESNGGFEV